MTYSKKCITQSYKYYLNTIDWLELLLLLLVLMTLVNILTLPYSSMITIHIMNKSSSMLVEYVPISIMQ